MRRSGAPSQRRFNGLLPFTPPTLESRSVNIHQNKNITNSSFSTSTNIMPLESTPKSVITLDCDVEEKTTSENPCANIFPSVDAGTDKCSNKSYSPSTMTSLNVQSISNLNQGYGKRNFLTPSSTLKLNSSSISNQFSKPLLTNNTNTVESTCVFRYMTCVWAKKSNRKHKKWEGDAIIKVGKRSVVLIDTEGKEIGRSSGYKVTELEELDDGGHLGVGGKEVEITGITDAVLWEKTLRMKEEFHALTSNVKADEIKENINMVVASTDVSISSDVSTQSPVMPTFKPFKMPSRTNKSDNQFIPETKVKPGVPMFDPHRTGALVMPRPPCGHRLHEGSKLVDVVVDPFISRHLRPHQREGVMFMYENLMGFKRVETHDGDIPVQGAILGDEMGLGKTLQTVTLIWTFLKQSPIAGSVLAKKILIVAPSSLLKNWEAEFRKWLGSERIRIHIADTGDKVSQFRSYISAPILILSYEMLVRTLDDIQKVSWDLLVCDEAHRMKNSSIKTSSSLNQITCERRLFLTGTPVQNDLGEYFNLIDAVCPGLLGSRASFRDVELKIDLGRQPDASVELKEEGRRAMEQLGESTKQIILRRTSKS